MFILSQNHNQQHPKTLLSPFFCKWKIQLYVHNKTLNVIYMIESTNCKLFKCGKVDFGTGALALLYVGLLLWKLKVHCSGSNNRSLSSKWLCYNPLKGFTQKNRSQHIPSSTSLSQLCSVSVRLDPRWNKLWPENETSPHIFGQITWNIVFLPFSFRWLNWK